MERKLATIRKIDAIDPIPGADNIDVATVGGWKLVVLKNEFQPGDLAIYCEIDSLLPIKPEFEFLRKSSYKKTDTQEGFRLKTMKMRGQISQGLLLQMDVMPVGSYNLGDDVTELLGIQKYEPPIPADLSGKIRGFFPSQIPKTDEERIQNLNERYEELKSHRYFVTEKLEGTSATYYWFERRFGVCSRGLDFDLDAVDNSFTRFAKANNLEEKFKNLNKNIALQGEMIGEGVQGNIYKINGQCVMFFNAFDIDKYEYIKFDEFLNILTDLELIPVPILSRDYMLPYKLEDLLLEANGKSMLNPKTKREGIVLKTIDRSISFKVISNNYLLNEK